MIDAHVHLWSLGRNGCTWPTPDLAPIYHDVTLEDLSEVALAGGVDRAILVQSQEDDADTAWLLSIANHPLIAGVVSWIDFAGADAATGIGRLALNYRLLGLRPMVQDREADWYDAPELDPAFAAMTALQLVLDAFVRPRHLPSLFKLAVRHPDLSIVIVHGAKPVPTDLGPWSEQMDMLVRLPNVSCKLSGLVTVYPPRAPADAIGLVSDRLWNAFGAERLIWGSDWPVLTLAGDYASWLNQYRRMVPAGHHKAVFDSNARRIYGLQQ
ncbi:MAG: amidohydrolase family protein [Sphingomicrobium sp.]